MNAPDFIFRLDRHRRFLSGPSLALAQDIERADRSASDCADRTFVRAWISHLQRLPASIARATI